MQRVRRTVRKLTTASCQWHWTVVSFFVQHFYEKNPVRGFVQDQSVILLQQILPELFLQLELLLLVLPRPERI